MSPELRRSFLLRVLLPGLLTWGLYTLGNALPRPTEIDTLFYLGAILCALAFVVGSIFWTARFVAVSLGLIRTQAPADPDLAAALLQHTVQKKLAQSVSLPHDKSNPLAHYTDSPHGLKVLRDQNQLVLLFYDRDNDEPLRPQTFALNHHRLSQALELFDQGKVYVLQEGPNELYLSSAQADTEDGNGPHFGVPLPENFAALLREQLADLPAPLPPQEELQALLNDLQSGRRLRFDPAVVAALSDLRELPELDPLLLPHLVGNPDQVLFAVAFLFQRSETKGELVEPLIQLIETLSPGPHREAAESSLLACLESNPQLKTAQLADRVFARIPWDHGAQAICSCLRLIQALGPLAQPYHPQLLEHLQAWNAGPSSRLDWGNTTSMIESILKGSQ